MKTNKIFGISILIYLLCFVTELSGQFIISYTPTNYSSKITLQTDTSSAINPWGSWQNTSADAEDLGANTLVLTHTAFFNGSGVRSVLQLVDIYIYDARNGNPLGGYHLTVFGVNRRNGNIQYATTNVISAAEMFPLSPEWMPYRVGSRTVTVDISRTVERCSSIVMSARNIGSSPNVIYFYCAVDTQKGFSYPFSFLPGERKPIVLNIKEGNFQANRSVGRFNYFWINSVDVP